MKKSKIFNENITYQDVLDRYKKIGNNEITFEDLQEKYKDIDIDWDNALYQFNIIKESWREKQNG